MSNNSNNESSSAEKHQDLDLRSAFDLIQELLPPDKIAAYSLRLSSATVYNTLTMLMILTFQRFGGGKSLEAIVRDVVGQHTYVFPDCKRVREGTLSSNPSGFSKARGRLSVEHAESYCDEIAEAIIQRGTSAFQDRQIYVIDGTTIAFSQTSELSNVYPPATNQFGKTVCARDNLPPVRTLTPSEPIDLSKHKLICDEELGGHLNSYRAAA